VLGAVRVIDRAECLLVRGRVRRHGGDDDRLGATAERLLRARANVGQGMIGRER
jgi:hypothetical protein